MSARLARARGRNPLFWLAFLGTRRAGKGPGSAPAARLWGLAAGLFACLALAVSSGCSRASREQDRPFRLGYFPNVTHAQALVGAHEEVFRRAVPGIELKVFNAGPQAMEALLAGEIDMAYVGAAPALIAYVRSGRRLRVVAGAVSGGAVLVVRDATGPQDLKGKRLAAPQIGNTQDVALRHWLQANGLNASDAPGREVTVLPLANADILALFRRGEIDGAWVPEPWGSRLVEEGGGSILVDERTLWPQGRFATTVIVATEHALARKRQEVAAVVRAHQALTERWKNDPARFPLEVNQGFEKETGKRLPPEVLASAFSRMEPTTDPMAESLETYGKWAAELGYLPPSDLSGVVDRSLLQPP